MLLHIIWGNLYDQLASNSNGTPLCHTAGPSCDGVHSISHCMWQSTPASRQRLIGTDPIYIYGGALVVLSWWVQPLDIMCPYSHSIPNKGGGSGHPLLICRWRQVPTIAMQNTTWPSIAIETLLCSRGSVNSLTQLEQYLEVLLQYSVIAYSNLALSCTRNMHNI